MIAPLPQATLDANPAFARVWEHVTTQILEGDGSRSAMNEERRRKWKDYQASVRPEQNDGSGERKGEEDGQDVDDETYDASEAEDVSIEEELHKARVARVRLNILREVLRDIAFVDGLERDEVEEEPETDYKTADVLQKRTQAHRSNGED